MQDRRSLVRRRVGEHLRRLREAAGWTLDEVVDRASREGVTITSSTLSRVERGKTSLPAEALSVLCESLGTSLTYIEELIRTARAREAVDLTGADVGDLVETGQRLMREGNVRRALDHFESARDLMKLDEDRWRSDPLAISVRLWMADCHLRLRNFRVALDLAGQVLNDPRADDAARLAAVLMHVRMGHMTGDLYRGRVFAEHAERLLANADDRTRAYALFVIGNLHYKAEDWDRAVPLLDEARRLYASLGIEIERLRATIAWGFSLHRCGRRDEGLRAVREAFDAADRAGYKQVALHALYMLGRMALFDGEFDDARARFDSAAALARQLGLKHELFLAWYGLWQVEQAAGQREAAARAARVLHRLVRQISPDLPEAREFLALEAVTSNPPPTRGSNGADR